MPVHRAIHERTSAGASLARVDRHESAVDGQSVDLDGARVGYAQASLQLLGSHAARGALARRGIQITAQRSHGYALIVEGRREARGVRGNLRLLQRLALLVLLYHLLYELEQGAVDSVAAVDDRPRRIVDAFPTG